MCRVTCTRHVLHEVRICALWDTRLRYPLALHFWPIGERIADYEILLGKIRLLRNRSRRGMSRRGFELLDRWHILTAQHDQLQKHGRELAHHGLGGNASCQKFGPLCAVPRPRLAYTGDLVHVL